VWVSFAVIGGPEVSGGSGIRGCGDEIGEGLFPVGVPVIRAGAVEAGMDQDGEVFEGWHGATSGKTWSVPNCSNYRQALRSGINFFFISEAKEGSFR